MLQSSILPIILCQMNIKILNKVSNPLSNKIIENGKMPFKLWLEFEETSPWDDVENDFANIIVNTLDGRSYGINVWTIKYLSTAHNEEAKRGNTNYVIPPDLFVKELTRDCIEATIKELLHEGDLEDILNMSTFGLRFIEPYLDAFDMDDDSIQSLITELNAELPHNHVLSNTSFELIARKTNSDDIILNLENERIAVVCLTWKTRQETEGRPLTRIYKDKRDFWSREMKQEIIEFNG